MRFWWVYIFLAAGIASADPSTAPATRPATGSMTLFFNQRSPLSDYAKLQERLGLPADKIGPDYDLTKSPFEACVPRDYDGSVPYGFICYILPDGAPVIHNALMQVFQRHHLIYGGPHDEHLPLAAATGLTLDGVYNLEHRYNIDPSRLYLIGAGKNIQPIAFCTPDIFAGEVSIWWIGYFRQIQNLDGYPMFAPPAADLLEQSKTRTHILAFEDDPTQASFRTQIAGAMTDDGFQHVAASQVSRMDVLQAPWLEQMLAILEPGSRHPEANLPATQPAAAPAAADAPATSEADHLLKLAQMYIDNQQPDKARDKLNQIVQQYPNDPAAQKAQQLLNQIQAQ